MTRDARDTSVCVISCERTRNTRRQRWSRPRGGGVVALWRVHVELEDRPGRLGELATAVGATGCNIISVHVVGEPTDAGSATDELIVRVPAGIDPSVLIMAAASVGAPVTLHVPAEA